MDSTPIPQKKITKQERATLNAQRMYDALRYLAKDFDTAESIIRNSEKNYGGLPSLEALEMVYDNMQGIALTAIKGIKRPEGAEIVL